MDCQDKNKTITYLYHIDTNLYSVLYQCFAFFVYLGQWHLRHILPWPCCQKHMELASFASDIKWAIIIISQSSAAHSSSNLHDVFNHVHPPPPSMTQWGHDSNKHILSKTSHLHFQKTGSNSLLTTNAICLTFGLWPFIIFPPFNTRR